MLIDNSPVRIEAAVEGIETAAKMLSEFESIEAMGPETIKWIGNEIAGHAMRIRCELDNRKAKENATQS